MSDETEKKTVPTWGYHKTKEPQIFDLAEGESLPRGWSDAPVSKEEPTKPGDEPKIEETKPDAV